MSDLMLDVGLANQLKMSFRRNGWTEEMVNNATKGNFLANVGQVLLGYASIGAVEHLIDCDADPYCCSGNSVLKHQKGGLFKWDISQVGIYSSKTQRENGSIKVGNLLEELKAEFLFNSCVLTYLLAHPNLIPEEWKGKNVYFFGTTYRDYRGRFVARHLHFYGDEWRSESEPVSSLFKNDFVAYRISDKIKT